MTQPSSSSRSFCPGIVFPEKVNRVLSLAKLAYPLETIDQIFLNRTAYEIHNYFCEKHLSRLTFCFTDVQKAEYAVLSVLDHFQRNRQSPEQVGRSLLQTSTPPPPLELTPQSFIKQLTEEKKESKEK